MSQGTTYYSKFRITVYSTYNIVNSSSKYIHNTKNRWPKSYLQPGALWQTNKAKNKQEIEICTFFLRSLIRTCEPGILVTVECTSVCHRGRSGWHGRATSSSNVPGCILARMYTVVSLDRHDNEPTYYLSRQTGCASAVVDLGNLGMPFDLAFRTYVS